MGGRDINDDTQAGGRQEQFGTLLQRPDIDQTTVALRELITEVQRLTSAEFGLPPWEPPPDEPERTAACGFDFPDVGLKDAQTRTISGGTSRGPIPDAAWDEAVRRVAEVAAKYGFDRHRRMLDKPGDHDVEFFGAHGASFRLGTARNTTIGVTSGCHLTAEAKAQGA